MNFARIRILYNKHQEFIQQGSGGYTKDFFGICATISIGREMPCLLYTGFFYVYTVLSVNTGFYVYTVTISYVHATINQAIIVLECFGKSIWRGASLSPVTGKFFIMKWNKCQNPIEYNRYSVVLEEFSFVWSSRIQQVV